MLDVHDIPRELLVPSALASDDALKRFDSLAAQVTQGPGEPTLAKCWSPLASVSTGIHVSNSFGLLNGNKEEDQPSNSNMLVPAIIVVTPVVCIPSPGVLPSVCQPSGSSSPVASVWDYLCSASVCCTIFGYCFCRDALSTLDNLLINKRALFVHVVEPSLGSPPEKGFRC